MTNKIETALVTANYQIIGRGLTAMMHGETGRIGEYCGVVNRRQRCYFGDGDDKCGKCPEARDDKARLVELLREDKRLAIYPDLRDASRWGHGIGVTDRKNGVALINLGYIWDVIYLPFGDTPEKEAEAFDVIKDMWIKGWKLEASVLAEMRQLRGKPFNVFGKNGIGPSIYDNPEK
ncbi:MAG TPA: hypothetical protein VF828_04065 [Patescibacteria group bacterium]